MSVQRRLGAMFDRAWEPEELVGYARGLDALGVDDLWVVEDLGWAGGISSAAVALAATARLRVGIGIMPAPLRNPALLAMEVATLARLYPGRVAAGIGHGVTEWMAQVGAGTTRKLALLEETISTVRALLRGEHVFHDGQVVHVRDVTLTHPPTVVPPVLAGVVRPRSLALSGRVADGTIIAEGHGPQQIAAALGHINAVRDHELAVLVFLCLDGDADTAPVIDGQAAWLGVEPDQVYRIGGSAEEAAGQVRELWEVGASTVALRPIGDDPLGQVRAVAAALACRPGPTGVDPGRFAGSAGYQRKISGGGAFCRRGTGAGSPRRLSPW